MEGNQTLQIWCGKKLPTTSTTHTPQTGARILNQKYVVEMSTLPESNSSPLKRDLLKGNFIFQPSILREYVSFQGEYNTFSRCWFHTTFIFTPGNNDPNWRQKLPGSSSISSSSLSHMCFFFVSQIVFFSLPFGCSLKNSHFPTT